MGEAWSDWFASDLQVRDGLKTDDLGTPGEIDIGDYTDLDPHTLRSQALDCPVGAVDARCPGGAAPASAATRSATSARSPASPEVHADGEIWVETLWDLRQALQVKTGSADDASDVAEILVADGMRLSPPEPSMLDMRNAILTADQIDFGGAFHDLVWDVFRKRGMGYFAAATDGADTQPVEDFTPPPDPNGPKGTVDGHRHRLRLRPADRRRPRRLRRPRVAARVRRLPRRRDGRDGRYTIEDVPGGDLPEARVLPVGGLRPGARAATSRSPRTRRRRATCG